MPAYKELFHRLRTELQSIYDAGEAAAISREVLSEVTGSGYSQHLALQDDLADAEAEEKINRMTRELLTGKPLQYVLGYGWFMNRKFMVNGHTLIPRPETEELVQWVIDDWQNHKYNFSVLDIGTGTGCIPVSLKLALDKASITACDISEGALQVAKSNAVSLNASVSFTALDFLEQADELGIYDVIVSNPPYIPVNERETLHANVRDFEPGTALFVPNDDAQLFYQAIAIFGKTHLAEGGAIYCELHQEYAIASRDLFIDAGYQVELRKDINGHWRMLKATL